MMAEEINVVFSHRNIAQFSKHIPNKYKIEHFCKTKNYVQHTIQKSSKEKYPTIRDVCRSALSINRSDFIRPLIMIVRSKISKGERKCITSIENSPNTIYFP